MKNTVYLKSGQKANLVGKVGDSMFIVEPYFNYTDQESGVGYEDLSEKIVVTKVFTSAPIEVLDKEHIDLKEKIEKTKKEYDKLSKKWLAAEQEVHTLERTKTDLSKFIINRSEFFNAKERITIFVKEEINPVHFNPKRLSISLEYTIHDNKEKYWIYKLDEEGSRGSSHCVDIEYGFLIDKTDEEITIIAKERAIKLQGSLYGVQDWRLQQTDDKYLSPELLLKKQELNRVGKQKAAQRAKAEIEKLQKELNEL